MDHDQALFRLFGKFCLQGAVLYTEGSPGEELFVVQSGAVRVSLPGGEAEERGPGRILGEEAFFGRVPRVGRAEIVKDSRLLRVSDRKLDAVARHGPELALAMGEQLLELAGEAARSLDSLLLSRHALRAEPHLRTAGALTGEELAELAGLPVRDARAVLEALAERGALHREPGGYRVADTTALERTVLAMAAAGS